MLVQTTPCMWRFPKDRSPTAVRVHTRTSRCSQNFPYTESRPETALPPSSTIGSPEIIRTRSFVFIVLGVQRERPLLPSTYSAGWKRCPLAHLPRTQQDQGEHSNVPTTHPPY